MTKPIPLPSPAAGFGVVPFGDADGMVIQHAGRYARECVLTAFEMIGGVQRLADWAGKNPDLFYTRLYSKVITREVEVSANGGIEDLLARVDAEDASGAVVDSPDYSIVERDG